MGVLLRVTAGPHAGEEFVIDHVGSFMVGRSTRATFPMPQDLLLSREHFRIESHPSSCQLTDLGSTNGTKINGLRVERELLRDGDLIAAGDSCFEVRFTEPDSPGRSVLTCAGCGVRLEPEFHPFWQAPTQTDVAVIPVSPRATSRAAETGTWLCENCEARRKEFPETHPDYLIEEQIGEGGMGAVYRARQISKNRPVAIKMMRAHNPVEEAKNTAGNKALNYFKREIEVLKDLLSPNGKCHPNIVAFYEIFEIDGQFHLVMEYVDGKNALEWIRSIGQPLPVATAAHIGRQLLSALDYAHSKGYVHRDVKPSNLLVMGPVHRPRVKLSDFGLAKSFSDTNVFTSLTRQGDVGGSIGFLSPDHIRQFSDVKEPADIYSAGATLYYLLTNRYPYLGFDPHRPDSYEIILEHPPVPLRAYRPDAPETLERILNKALQKQPRDRWKSARQMGEALRLFTAPFNQT